MLKTFTNAISASTNQGRARQELRVTNAQQVAFLVHFRKEKLNSIYKDHHDLLSVNSASASALKVVSDERLVR